MPWVAIADPQGRGAELYEWQGPVPREVPRLGPAVDVQCKVCGLVPRIRLLRRLPLVDGRVPFRLEQRHDAALHDEHRKLLANGLSPRPLALVKDATTNRRARPEERSA